MITYIINEESITCHDPVYTPLTDDTVLLRGGPLLRKQRICDNLQKLDINIDSYLLNLFRIEKSYQCSLFHQHEISIQNCINCDDAKLKEMAHSVEYSVRNSISLKNLITSHNYTTYKAEELSSAIIYSLKDLEADYLELDAEIVKEVFDEHLNEKSFTTWVLLFVTFGLYHYPDNAIVELVGDMHYFQKTLDMLDRDLDS